MIKDNLKKLFYLLFLALGIISCRQQDALLETQNEQKTFNLFNKNNSYQYKDSQSNSSLGKLYALDFQQAYYSYDLKNGTNYTGINVKGPIVDSYINFTVHSQIIEDKNGDIYMYFPVIKNRKVTDIYFSTINKENTLLGLYKLKNTVQEYNGIFSAFEEIFNRPNDQVFSKNTGVTDIEEVVITGPTNPSDGIGITGPDACEMYGQCNNNGGGGSGSSGGSGGGGGGIPVVSTTPPPPNIAIKDIKDFLSCLDISKSANLTVYAQRMGKGNGVGHAFISITQGSNTMTFGFYPKEGFPYNANGPSSFGDDSGHAYTHSLNVGTISPTQLQLIIATSIAFSPSIYDVNLNNCADFTLHALGYAGVNTNTAGLDTPNTVANLIVNNNGNTNQGNAPKTKRCK